MLTTDSDHTTATLDADEQRLRDRAETADESRPSGGPTCTNCHEPLPKGGMAVCPHCGYYASLGRCIELDKNWEQLAVGQAQPASRAEDKTSLATHLQIWADLIPAWGWLLIACNVGVVLLSIFARVSVPSGLARTLWSVAQLFIGLSVFSTCHFIAYLRSIAEDASMNLLDIVLRPLSVWKDVVRHLPETLRVAIGGSCGFTAVIGSIFIIGSLPYGVLLDWGIEAPPQKNLLGAVLAQAQKVEGEEKGLEEAIGDFAGTVGDLDEFAETEPVEPEKNVRVDCVIVGYTVEARDSSELTSLLVAREFQGQLKFLGRLDEGLTEKVRRNLLEELAEYPRERPFLPTPAYKAARWVQPKFICRVKCVRQTRSGSLVGMEFESMAGRID